MLYTSLFVWEMSAKILGLVMRVMDLMFDDVWIGYVNFDEFGERVYFLMIGLREMLDFCG